MENHITKDKFGQSLAVQSLDFKLDVLNLIVTSDNKLSRSRKLTIATTVSLLADITELDLTLLELTTENVSLDSDSAQHKENDERFANCCAVLATKKLKLIAIISQF